MADLITKIASDEVIDAAYAWLCKRREKWSPQNDVWDLRWRWQTAKPAIQAALLAGEYVFQPLYEVRLPQEIREYWGTQDALVLKAVALVLGEHLKPFISANCVHVTGHGGGTTEGQAFFGLARRGRRFQWGGSQALLRVGMNLDIARTGGLF
jgi:RNA-directed DNA polymerase